MKLNKVLAPILTSSLVITSGCFVLTSCNNSSISTDIEQYISDRSFSLMASGIYRETRTKTDYLSNLTFGTGWIIDDSTPSITNDYRYYVATNWHVVHGFDLIPTYEPERGYEYLGMIYSYADQSSTNRVDNIINFDNYSVLENGAYIQMSPNNFVYPNEAKLKQINCIDFYVCEIDFARVNAFSNSIRQKLDRLNEFRKVNGYINNFVSSDDPNIIAKKKYVAGYPFKEGFDGASGGRWELHDLEPKELSYVEKGNPEESHWITDDPDKEQFYYCDVSPQYACSVDKGSSWLTGGASGSMLITEDKEVCGIYWGGLSEEGTRNPAFWPRFSLFKTNDKDFIKQWTK